MAGLTPDSNPRGSKRGACDRCRGQKLRCLRQDQSQDSPQAKCVRCSKAGATCSFGIPKRAGRPPGSTASSSQEWRGDGGGKAEKGRMVSRPTVNTSRDSRSFANKANGGQEHRRTGGWASGRLSEDNTADQDSEADTEDTTPLQALSPSSLDDTSGVLAEVSLDFPAFAASSTTNLPWPDDTLPPFYNNNTNDDDDDDAGGASGLEPFGPEYSWAFNHYQAPSMGLHIPTAPSIHNDDKSSDVSLNPYGTPAQTCSATTHLSAASDEAMDLDVPSRTTHPPTAPFPTSNALPPSPRPHHRHTPSLSSATPPSTSLHLPFDDETLHPHERQHRRMQSLSTLAMDLYAQLVAHDSPPPPPPPAFHAHLVGTVLHSSSTFLHLLTSFPAATDLPTVLQLLTCYIRITHLYALMLGRLLDYLLTLPAAPPPVFPGMTVGGFSLDRFGTFQVKLLVQISVHVLGEIEGVLGVPEGVRVLGAGGEQAEGRGGEKGTGVLEASVSGGFVEGLIREGAGRRGGRGKLREQLERLGEVLKRGVEF